MHVLLLVGFLAVVSLDAVPFRCGDDPAMPDIHVHDELDTDSDTEGDGISSADTVPAEQGAIEIQISNAAGVPFYVDLSMRDNGVFSCVNENGGRCNLFEPFCMSACEVIPPSEPCENTVCNPYPRVFLVDAETPLKLTWDGLLRVENTTFCTLGACYDFERPAPGTYQITIRTWDAYTCLTTECGVVGNIISFGAPAGSSRLHTFTIQVPRSEDLDLQITN